MQKIRIGYDNNLGIQNDFAKTVQCDVVGYQDISHLVKDFSSQELNAIFVQAGTLPYLNNYESLCPAYNELYAGLVIDPV